MKMEITSTIQNINEKEWNALAGTDFPGKITDVKILNLALYPLLKA
jgi:hypothetical protein